MRDRLRRLWERLRFDPTRARLPWWLAATNVALVVIVVAGLSLSAVDMLRELADEQGKARAQLAGAIAREELRRFSEDALSFAHVQADRPTVQRMVSENRPDVAAALLRRACEAAGVDVCAILADEDFVAHAGPPVPWPEIVTAHREQGERFMAAPAGMSTPVLGATVPLPGRPGARVYILQLLDSELAERLTRHVGQKVTLISYPAFTAAPVDELTPVHSAALADGRSAVQRVPALESYVSSFPVFAATGEAIALIETRLPAAEIDASADRLTRRLLLTALVLSVLAVLGGIVLGQLVAGPVSSLTEAAMRLGKGDFSTSIPPGGPAEIGALARTMEDMRRNLVDLTGTLRRQEAAAQAVLAGIVEGVFAVDRDRKIRYVNPQAARLLGVNPDEAVGRFCGDVLRPRADEDGRRPCETSCPILLARTAGHAEAVEWLERPSQGPRRTVVASSGMHEGLQVQVIRDETELEAVRRARDTVLANISHEFRTPLAAQLASIELLRDGLEKLQPGQVRELVLSLERGTVRLTQLIDNLLESVRIEAGQLAIRKQNVSLETVVEDARALIGSLLASRNQTLDVSIPEDLPTIRGDALRLTQVLVNLITNASKFAPEASTIRIGAEAGEGQVVLWIEDEGPGVPEGDPDAIFGRFRRGADIEPEPGGLGLGLWIVKSIVARHGGTIEATRTPEGRTRFAITLRASEGDE